MLFAKESDGYLFAGYTLPVCNKDQCNGLIIVITTTPALHWTWIRGLLSSPLLGAESSSAAMTARCGSLVISPI